MMRYKLKLKNEAENELLKRTEKRTRERREFQNGDSSGNVEAKPRTNTFTSRPEQIE